MSRNLALITGGSRGLGLALCRQLRAAGYTVVEFSRSAPHPWSVRLDLASTEAVRATLPASLAAIDTTGCEELLVVSNAGTLAPIGQASRKPSAEVLASLNTNFSSAILFMSMVAGRFQDLPCRKVMATISSGAALKGYAGWSLYCAAKAGLDNFMRALAAEQRLEPHPFVPVSIDPGVMDTDMQAYIRATAEADFPEVARFIRRKAEGELSFPDDVAAGALKVLARTDLLPGERYSAMR